MEETKIRVRFRIGIEICMFITVPGQPLSTTQPLIQRVVGALARMIKQEKHKVRYPRDIMPFTWRKLRVNMKIVRLIVSINFYPTWVLWYRLAESLKKQTSANTPQRDFSAQKILRKDNINTVFMTTSMNLALQENCVWFVLASR